MKKGKDNKHKSDPEPLNRKKIANITNINMLMRSNSRIRVRSNSCSSEELDLLSCICILSCSGPIPAVILIGAQSASRAVQSPHAPDLVEAVQHEARATVERQQYDESHCVARCRHFRDRHVDIGYRCVTSTCNTVQLQLLVAYLAPLLVCRCALAGATREGVARVD